FSAASASITLVFFAMFGTVFLIAQYLQFVLGFTPFQAGLRVMPVATLIVAAPLSARLTEKFGSKIVVTAGLVIVATALTVMAGVDVDGGYGRVALALSIMGFGMGMTMAPATDSIMGSLPLAKAGVGSAMNDTTRQVGGALGVAVLGSVLASTYSAAMTPVVAALRSPASDLALDSVGGAAGVAAQIGEAGAGLLNAAASAFVDGMGNAVLVAAGVALIGAVVSALFLPSRATDDQVDLAKEAGVSLGAG
ncbi:MAG: MFS transporter, partial [Acidimicrobiia bacterium]